MSEPKRWTYGQLIACAQREVEMRERVYPAWVTRGKMRQAEADHEITAMREILRVLTVMRDEQRGPYAQPQGKPE